METTEHIYQLIRFDRNMQSINSDGTYCIKKGETILEQKDCNGYLEKIFSEPNYVYAITYKDESGYIFYINDFFDKLDRIKENEKIRVDHLKLKEIINGTKGKA